MGGSNARRSSAVGAATLSLGSLFVVLAIASPAPAHATDVWEAHTGDPCCGLPDSLYKYLDADTACRGEVQPHPSLACTITFWDTLRNSAGPQTPGYCAVDWQCLCGDCIIGTPEDPRNFHSAGFAGKFTGRKLRTCSGATPNEFLGQCFEDTPKSKGPCKDCDLAKANPVNIGSGNKFQSETVYRDGQGQLQLVLFYNSQAGSSYFEKGLFGTHWSSRYSVAVRDSGQGIVAVHRPDGRDLRFQAPASGNLYLGDADNVERLEKLTDAIGTFLGWRVTSGDNDEVEEFDATGNLRLIRTRAGLQQNMAYSTRSTPPSIAPWAGLLVTVTDAFGRRLSLTYDALGRVNKMTDPAGGEYLFAYDTSGGPAGAGNLSRITFPDATFRTYFYREAANVNGGVACTAPSPVLSNVLTGITDEKGTRYATWTYDCQARATSSTHVLAADAYTFDYGSGTSTSYVDPLGTRRSAAIQRILGVALGTGTTQASSSGASTVSTAVTRDANGNRTSLTDFNGNRNNFTYDLARNLETSRTEGLTAAGEVTPHTRTISTEWDRNFRLPARIAEPLRITTNVYDPDGSQCGARGALCSKTIQATADADGAQSFSATPTGTPRTWTYTYNAHGFVLTVDGPRTDVPDVTTYTYYADDDADLGKRGNVATISNAAGHVTSITAYNAHGQPLTIVDANGMTTTLTYDARLRLKSRSAGGELTRYDYDNAGQLTRVTLPYGSYLDYTYDAAHRLTGMSDNLGNSIAYTLDAIGNRTREEVRDPASSLAQVRSRIYNSLNRLFREIGAENQTTEYGYDDQGNVLTVKDPLDRVTSNQYDALNRLKQVTDAALGVTRYAYNGLDALTQVTDPRNLATGYTVDGLGNLTAQSSPDTGNTASTYDAAGNLLTQTDGKGQVTTYAYDALNRVTLVTFHDGSKHTYIYDQGTHGIGRLTSITETSGANIVTSQTAYGYDVHGRVTSDTRTIGGVQYTTGYHYDGSGRLVGMTYPSGRTVAYTLDALGRVSQLDTTKNDQSQNVLSGVAYQPFGAVKSFTFGNGQVYSRNYDRDGRISAYAFGTAQSFQIGYDAASRIESIVDLTTPQYSNSYGYDELDRLTRALGAAADFAYTYDPVGNRTSKSAGSQTDIYTYSAASNRLSAIAPAAAPPRSFVYDANGSTTAEGSNSYTYDVRGRMVSALGPVGTVDFQVNALGQRVRKTSALGDTVFHYDTRGRLIAETDPAGALKREIFYLGDIPVAVFQ
jgi:YD repeat-containing protein